MTRTQRVTICLPASEQLGQRCHAELRKGQIGTLRALRRFVSQVQTDFRSRWTGLPGFFRGAVSESYDKDGAVLIPKLLNGGTAARQGDVPGMGVKGVNRKSKGSFSRCELPSVH